MLVFDRSFNTPLTAAYELCQVLPAVALFSLQRRFENDLEIFDTGIELLPLRRVLIEILLQLSPFAAFATAYDEILSDGVVTKWKNAPSTLAKQLLLLSPVLSQKPHLYLIKLSFSAGSSCVRELVRIEIFVKDRSEARLPLTLLTRRSPDSDCAAVESHKKSNLPHATNTD